MFHLLPGSILWCGTQRYPWWNLIRRHTKPKPCSIYSDLCLTHRFLHSVADDSAVRKARRTELKPSPRTDEVALIQGRLRSIHQMLSFIEHPIDKSAVLILGSDRCQALHGDLVSVAIHPIGRWKVLGTEIPREQVSPVAVNQSRVIPPEVVAPLDENIETDVAEITPPVAPDYAVPVKQLNRTSYQNWFGNKTLAEVAAEPDRSRWPAELPFNIDLRDRFYAMRHLPSPALLRTGRVQKILVHNNSARRLLGHVTFCGPSQGRITRKSLKLNSESKGGDALCFFVPNELNHSIIKLDPFRLPKKIKTNHSLGLQNNYVCIVNGWNESLNMPQGYISEQLGDISRLDEATKALLIRYGIEDRAFRDEHLQGLPDSPEKFQIPIAEYIKRRDFRSCCIMSIDPATAKDIDDALHIRQLRPDLYEVGVHIADVSYFVKPGTALDREAARRSTSVYLVQKVIPMLPPILSEHLCSLHPATDKLAFSVVMKVRPTGEVVGTWFGRSLVRSRIKLSYEQASAILEDQSNKDLKDLVPQPEKPFGLQHVRDSLIQLNKIAQKLREKRIENGALTLQKAKIEFDLPSDMFDTEADNSEKPREIWPRGFSLQYSGVSNQLIEEWMLAANQAVAHRMFQAFCKRQAVATATSTTDSPPEYHSKVLKNWYGALLRNHSAPRPSNLQDLITLLKAGGIDLADGKSKTISTALREYNETLKHSGCTGAEREALMGAISHLVYIRMNMATYFSLDALLNIHTELSDTFRSNPECLFAHTWHYGLSVPLYTHFTSPIRRYADLLVHRQLASILSRGNLGQQQQDDSSDQQKTVNNCEAALSRLSIQAEWCNSRRMMSRRAQEASQRIFLTACLRDCGSMTMNVTVIDFNANMIKVLLPELGVLIKMPLIEFFEHVTSWKFVPVAENRRSAECHVTDAQNTQTRATSHLLVKWSPSTESDSSDSVESCHVEAAPTLQKAIRILTVLPCKIFSQKDRLELNAAFLPTNLQSDAIATTTEEEPSVSVNSQPQHLASSTPTEHRTSCWVL